LYRTNLPRARRGGSAGEEGYRQLVAEPLLVSLGPPSAFANESEVAALGGQRPDDVARLGAMPAATFSTSSSTGIATRESSSSARGALVSAEVGELLELLPEEDGR
jgi:hypothetical protein